MKSRAYFLNDPPMLGDLVGQGIIKYNWFKVCAGVYLLLVFYSEEKGK